MLSSRREILTAAAVGAGTLAIGAVTSKADDSKAPEAKDTTETVATITIDNPLPGTILAYSFVASGTFALEKITTHRSADKTRAEKRSERRSLQTTDTILISCTLRRSDDTDIKTVSPAPYDPDAETWHADFDLAPGDIPDNTTGLKLFAVIMVNQGTPRSAEVGSLTISSSYGLTVMAMTGDPVGVAKVNGERRIGKMHKPYGQIIGITDAIAVRVICLKQGKPIGKDKKPTKPIIEGGKWRALHDFEDNDNVVVSDVITLFATNPTTGKPALYAAALTNKRVDKNWAENDN
jgi:hypothetical protein